MLDSLAQDLKYALRSLKRTPQFTAAAVMTLALGIGANTAIFSLIEAVMLRTLPVVAPDELQFVAIGLPGRTGDEITTASNYPWFERVRQRTDVFAGVTAFNIRSFKIASESSAETVVGQYVSGNYHAVAGVPMALGRGFSSENDRAPGSSPIAVISDGFWARRFNRRADVIGQAVVAGGRPLTIVGVTAPGFEGMVPGRSIEITLPLSIRIQDEPDFLTGLDSWTSMPLVARLKVGVDVRQAEAALQSVFREHMSRPETQGFSRTRDGQLRTALLLPAARGQARLRDDYNLTLTVLMGMVGVVLLIACINVANLLIVRGATRVREIAVRISVGAGRGRLLRQFLTESILLAISGGAIGFLLAGWGTRFIAALLRENQNPIVIDAQPDGTVLVFAGGLSALTGVLFGLAPAFGATRIAPTRALKTGSAGNGISHRSIGRQALAAGQIALSLVLIFGAALLVRTLQNLKGVDGGFETDNVVVFALDARDTTFPAARMSSLCTDVIERLRRRPGVSLASCSTMSPIDTAMEGRVIGIPSPPAGAPSDDTVLANTVTPDYFNTFGIQLLRGRLFTARDTAVTTRVAIVNETVARTYFGDVDPVGRSLAWGRKPDPTSALTIVGVVRDARQSLRDTPPPMVYQPLAQILEPPQDLTAAVRATSNPALVAGLVRDEVSALTRDVAVAWVRTMRQQIAASLMSERLVALLSAAFGALALLLACLGLYGVISYDVTRRRKDIGIRLALGATRATVVADVLRQVGIIATTGLVVGLIGAWFASQLVSGLLFGLTARDPATLVITALTLAFTAMLAGYLPARRAAQVDPALTLRAE
jgi:putative ABC transport system permease protein